ncbi:hypothetical protein QT497_05625 [Xanthomonas citri pv. citri]|uniref:hypothetical protein n=1 Tax=Xanthomonas TaxID=338 RepID=UPI0002C3E69B|nr:MULTISPECIES: hypothetical protein [Xanthomonas]AGI09219.1 Hypothetical Protein XCAW_03445 [Xanthomonas citri subsp. citri Aw12879]MBD1477711.1 hypothetical protein [Xanthomonas citri pv. citri]MBD1496336.1 hypothetical protein [Xanthomonas citri pv. citri]MBD1496838.1 hypothetical protein [Xanthomonas citri pv. citri]MBD1506501.1 hypothetical protein [Xanthomonas citri pv. citri]
MLKILQRAAAAVRRDGGGPRDAGGQQRGGGTGKPGLQNAAAGKVDHRVTWLALPSGQR